MYAEKASTTITTAADGTATAYVGAGLTGRVLAVIVTLDGTAPWTNTVDLTITAEATGEAIVTLTNVAAAGAYYPRVPVHDEAGAGATLDGTRKMREPVCLVSDRVKVVAAQGGDTKSGTVTVIVG